MNAEEFIASKMSSGGEGSLRQSRISNRIAWISVALSVAVMIVAIAVLGGFKYEIRAKATGFMGSVQLVAPGTSPVNELSPVPADLSYLNIISELDGVSSVSGVAYRSGMASVNGNIEGLLFKGVDSLYRLSFFEGTLSEGSVPDYHGRISNDILISSTTAGRLGVGVGDGVVTYFTGERVRVRKFNVVGIFDAQIENIDNMAITDLRQVQRLNGWSDNEVSSVEIALSPGADIDAMASRIEEIEYLEGTEEDMPMFVTSVKKVYGYLFDWLALLDLNVLMILVLMIVVAGFNMISAVLIILFEKISMIGLLKSLGMTNRQISGVFFLRSVKIVGKGVVFGTFLGVLLSLVQRWFEVIKLDPSSYFVSCVPIHLSVWNVLILDFAALVSIMAIVSLSSLFISRISPDRTLRVD